MKFSGQQRDCAPGWCITPGKGSPRSRWFEPGRKSQLGPAWYLRMIEHKEPFAPISPDDTERALIAHILNL